MIKGSVQQEDITFVNIYASSIGATKHLKQILTDLKGETDNNTIIAGGFNIPFTSMHRSSRQKVSEETSTLQYTLDHIVLIYIYRIFHPKPTEYTFFSSAHEHCLGYITSWDTNQALVSLRKLKSYHVPFPTTML